tara:strand:+ start:367 stop:972 length:606 start_codon:yes stop_codon:yes gene_type:complete
MIFNRFNRASRSGFSLLEVLISMGLFCVISLISMQYLQTSSLFREHNIAHLSKLRQFNISSNILRRDLFQALNVSQKNIYGEFYDSRVTGGKDNNVLRFTTVLPGYIEQMSLVKRIDYIFKDKTLFRYQFFSANPVNYSHRIESVLFEDIDKLLISFFDGRYWYQSWPNNSMQFNQVPELIKFNFLIDKSTYEFIFEFGKS